MRVLVWIDIRRLIKVRIVSEVRIVLCDGKLSQTTLKFSAVSARLTFVRSRRKGDETHILVEHPQFSLQVKPLLAHHSA